jgi:hypothetical protein
MRRTSEIQKLQRQVCVTGLDRALGTATPSEGVRTYKKEMTRVLQRLIALRKEPEPTVSWNQGANKWRTDMWRTKGKKGERS